MPPVQRALRCEALEERQLLSVTMSDYEQLMTYYVNRARVDPPAEAARFGIGLNDGLDAGTISPDPKQPLVPHQILHDVAAGHSQDMLDRDYFAHTNPEGDEAADRAQAAGYPSAFVGENISWAGTAGTLDKAAQPAERHESLFRSPTHRTNLLYNPYQDIGVGMRFGDFVDSGTTYNAAMVTQNFGRRNSDTHLVGVVFDDLNANGVYDLHEGLSGVTVEAGSQATTTGPAGGWSLQVAPGDYRVTASGTNFGGTGVGFVTVADRNVEVDFISGQPWAVVNFVHEAPFDARDLGTVDYRHLTALDTSGGELWFQWKTARPGTLTVETPATAGAALTLHDSALNEVASSAGGAEGPRIDVSVSAGEVYYLNLSATGSTADLRLANLVAFSGAEMQVAGTPEADHFEFAATGSYLVTINGVDYHLDTAKYDAVVFEGGNGENRATLAGGPDAEIARFFPDHGTFGENGFLVTFSGTPNVTAYGGGGEDAAFLYDSPGDDEFVSRRNYGKLSGEGFALETFDFMFNYGYATTRDGGVDVAYLVDTPEADKFKFDWPKPGQFFGKMYGGGLYYNRAKYFETIEATMTDGKNFARLFDSQGDDVFFGQKDRSRLVGSGFDVTVSGYGSLIAYASVGNDVAHLEDSVDSDTTRARPHKIVLWGGEDANPTYELTARRFDEYRFERKHGGYDRAKLHDTALDDHVELSGGTAAFYRNDGEMDLLYETVAFDWVKLYATPDTIAPNQNTLNEQPPLTFDLVYDPAYWESSP